MPSETWPRTAVVTGADAGIGKAVAVALADPQSAGPVVNALVAFLCSSAAAHVTGASWAVDGGMLQMGPIAGSHLASDDWRRG